MGEPGNLLLRADNWCRAHLSESRHNAPCGDCSFDKQLVNDCGAPGHRCHCDSQAEQKCVEACHSLPAIMAFVVAGKIWGSLPRQKGAAAACLIRIESFSYAGSGGAWHGLMSSASSMSSVRLSQAPPLRSAEPISRRKICYWRMSNGTSKFSPAFLDVGFISWQLLEILVRRVFSAK